MCSIKALLLAAVLLMALAPSLVGGVSAATTGCMNEHAAFLANDVGGEGKLAVASIAGERAVEITWHGHSCFTIRTSEGTTVVTDPFDDTLGYAIPDLKADVVTVSHEHFDHNCTKIVKGSPRILRGAVQRG